MQLRSVSSGRLRDAHFRELVSGSSAAFVLRLVGMLFSYFFTLLITRNFGSSAMGVFALSSTVLSVVSIFSRLGLDTALMRFTAEHASQGNNGAVKAFYVNALKVVVPFSILLSCLLFFSSPFIAEYIFKKASLAYPFKIISIAILPMTLIFIDAQCLRGLNKIREFSFLQNISNFMFATIILGCAHFFYRGDDVPLMAFVAGTFLGAFSGSLLWLKNIGPAPASHTGGSGAGSMLRVSLPMLLSTSMFFIMQWTDTIILGVFRTEAEVGIFSVSLKVATVASMTLIAVNSMAAPQFAKFYGKKDMESLEKTVRHTTKLIFWTSLPALVIIFLMPTYILGFFGEEFKKGAVALLLLTAGQFINAISGSVGALLNMTGRQRVFQHIMLAATGLNIILNIVLIPRYGINGAAFASMISVIFWNGASVLYIKNSFNILTLYVPLFVRVGFGK